MSVPSPCRRPSLRAVHAPLSGLLLALACLHAGVLKAEVPERLFSAKGIELASQSVILLVLEADSEGALRLLSSNQASGRAPLRPVATAPPSHPEHARLTEESLVFAFFDVGGEPLLAGKLEVPRDLHGPILDPESGEVRCRSWHLTEVVFSPKLPLPDEATVLRFYQPSLLLPAEPALLASGLRADPGVLGLMLRLELDLKELRP